MHFRTRPIILNKIIIRYSLLHIVEKLCRELDIKPDEIVQYGYDRKAGV
jgi:DNA-binding Xre family transcriptional regulator